MGKHSSPASPDPIPGNVTDDTWTKLMLAAADQPNGDSWVRNALANAGNARNN